MRTIPNNMTGVHKSELRINEHFYSIQGEGILAGTPMIFIRLAHCNLRCRTNNFAGFNCDTEFESHISLRSDDRDKFFEFAIDPYIDRQAHPPSWVLLTGGEPALHMAHVPLVDWCHWAGLKVAVETNGTIKIANRPDWICVSPKTPLSLIKQFDCDELKFVLKWGQYPPMYDEIGLGKFRSTNGDAVMSLSPRFNSNGKIDMKAAQWCVELVKEFPWLRLSMQTHKFIGVR